jgi:hypothetical protein
VRRKGNIILTTTAMTYAIVAKEAEECFEVVIASLLDDPAATWRNFPEVNFDALERYLISSERKRRLSSRPFDLARLHLRFRVARMKLDQRAHRRRRGFRL